jgi:hypothetical protein
MAKRPTFEIPDGITLDLTETSLSIKYDGSIRLTQTLGRDIGDIDAAGDVELKLDKVVGTIRAGGTLTIKGEVDATSLHAREIILGRKSIRCRAISATERITIGASKLSVDAIIAPEISLDSKASGRVTVIESNNDRGASKIKGGFSISDYDDMFGNADDWLAERGLSRLGATPPVKKKMAAPSDTADVEPQDEEEIEIEIDDEDIEDPLSLSIDDIEPLLDQGEEEDATADAPSDGPITSVDAELYEMLAEALGRITTCYEDVDLPPAVSELQLLVEQRDYDALRANITDVWNGLLGFHHKRGIRPHHQVTHAFNVIHGLVQD